MQGQLCSLVKDRIWLISHLWAQLTRMLPALQCGLDVRMRGSPVRSSLSVPGRFDMIGRPPAGRSLTPYGRLCMCRRQSRCLGRVLIFPGFAELVFREERSATMRSTTARIVKSANMANTMDTSS